MFPFSLFGCSDEAAACDASPPPPPPLSLTPFLFVLALTSALAQTRILPLLDSLVPSTHEGEEHFLPTHAPAGLRAAHADHARKSARRKAVALAFSLTVGLAAVLAVLIVGEVADIFDARARGFALGWVVPGLLLSLVVVIPWLQIMGFVIGCGWSFERRKGGRLPKFTWGAQMGLFAGWMFAFYSLGAVLPASADGSMLVEDGEEKSSLTRAALERIGIIGISLMALLSGFASVSSPWHVFGPPTRSRPVTEADLARRQSGLDVTDEMLLSKRHRLHALEQKSAEATSQPPSTGIMGRVWGSLRGATADEAEIKSLRMEIAGLVTMRENLASSLAVMRARRAEKVRAGSLLGRILAVPNYAFGAYCIYRILTTFLGVLRKMLFPSAISTSTTDPINRVLSLLTTHYDPTLDPLPLARLLSFLMSGLILLLSFNAVLQTFTLFSRLAPSLLRHARANLPLILGQIAAAYVISSALLLRSNLPREMGSAVGDALRSKLEPGFVEGWFEGWFLVACGLTVAGIWVGRRMGMGDDGWDDFEGEEMGMKRL